MGAEFDGFVHRIISRLLLCPVRLSGLLGQALLKCRLWVVAIESGGEIIWSTFACSFSEALWSVHFHVWNLQVWAMRLLWLVGHMVIRSSARDVEWYVFEQVFVQIPFHLFFEANIWLVGGACQLRGQQILRHKAVVIWSLSFYVTGVNWWSGAVLLKIKGSGDAYLFLEWSYAAVVWLYRHLVAIFLAFVMHNMIFLILIKGRVPQSFVYISSCTPRFWLLRAQF